MLFPLAKKMLGEDCTTEFGDLVDVSGHTGPIIWIGYDSEILAAYIHVGAMSNPDANRMLEYLLQAEKVSDNKKTLYYCFF